MSTKLKKGVIGSIAPITFADCVKLGDGTNRNILDIISTSNNGGTGSTNSKIITNGTVIFSYDANTNKLKNSSGKLVLNNGYINISENETYLGSIKSWNEDHFYYICYSDIKNTFEMVTNINNYNGFVLFGYSYGWLFPFGYPLNQITGYGNYNLKIQGKKYNSINELAIIGDSNSGDLAGNPTRWTPLINERLAVGNINGCAVHGHTVKQALDLQLSKVKSNTDTVFIMIGTNDSRPNALTPMGELKSINGSFDTNTFIGAYQSLIEGLYKINKKIRIIISTPIRTFGTTEYNNESLRPFIPVVKQIAEQYAIPCFDAFNLLGLNDINQNIYLSDTLHFNAEGSKLFRDMFINFVEANIRNI